MTGEALMPFVFTYRNWRGEVAERRAIPIRVWFGSTEWHPEPQWFLNANDLDKGETRDFAMSDIAASPPAPAEVEPVAYVSGYALAMLKLNGSATASLAKSRLNAGDAPLYTVEALSAAVAQARREALEEAARAAESLPGQRGNSPEHLVGMRIAAAIRALSDAAPAEEG